MKKEELLALGVPEDKVEKILEINKNDVEEEQGKTTELQGQLTTVQTQLKSFEGVDVEKLQGKITELQTDLQTKETEYQQKLAEQAFSALVNEQAMSAKCKNAKAVMALLDLDSLKSSQNQKEDIAKAIKTLQESDGYLFESTKPATRHLNSTKPGQGRDGLPDDTPTPLTLEEAVRNTLEKSE
ncbi:phage scaffolding protein [Scatolibacter rhodanostii]|uniref:phage scaffolding protein n=1 Tax=Scatolibacter rhodanostii TaxID=2014781 RepID=UPI000C079F69|nr:phage scaffolding protein [Scatolibacter rhodanostii]